MATIRLYLDARRIKNDGSCPLKLQVRHFSKFLLSVGISVRQDHWNGYEVIKGDRDYKQKNASIHSMLNKVQTLLLNLESSGEIDRLTDLHLRKRIEAVLGSSTGSVKVFTDYLDEFVATKDRDNTKTVYAMTRQKVLDYDAGCTFSTMDKRWLTQFTAWMKKEGLAVNTIGIHLRNIRAVFNYALDNEYTNLYPFRGFKIAKEATRKRNLTVEQLRMLRDYPCEDYQVKYRDMFFLMFYLIGVNPIDLFSATPSQVVNGRLEYKRAKTGKLYSVKIEPEALEILRKYRGKRHLIDVMDRINYNDYERRINNTLQEIGEVKRVGKGGKKVRKPLFPELTCYWARHTWATIAASLDIPIETISAALGHSYGAATTNIYIEYDQRKVDDANRRVIEYVNGCSG